MNTQFVNDVKNDRQVFETDAKCVPQRRVRLRYAAPQVMFKDKFIPIEQYYYILSWFVHSVLHVQRASHFLVDIIIIILLSGFILSSTTAGRAMRFQL